MGKMSRRKGSKYELECAERMRALGFPSAKRHLEVQKEEAMGYDLDGTAPFFIQCKHYAGGFNALKALGEIKEPGFHLAFIKQTGRGEYVAMDWPTFEALIREYVRGK